MRKTAISLSSVPREFPIEQRGVDLDLGQVAVADAVTAVSVMMRLSRIDNPGRLQIVPNRWSTVRSKYGSPSMLGISQP